MLRRLITLATVTAVSLSSLATPLLAAPEDRQARPGGQPGNGGPGNGRPGNGGAGMNRPGNGGPGGGGPGMGGPGMGGQTTKPIPGYRPPTGGNHRPPVGGNHRPPPGGNYRPPPGGNYRPPVGGGYPPGYRPPGGHYPPPGYYRPPPRPPGGWHGGYYPPSGYYYDSGPSAGGIIAGVAVTAGLLALLSAGNKPQQTVVQGGPPPQAYVPPRGSTGAPAMINVDLGGLDPAARPSASVCVTEASREIGATGGTEIRLDRVVEVEKGNGGYRFRLNLIGVYPDETRSIPMYCRATPEKIIELTFG